MNAASSRPPATAANTPAVRLLSVDGALDAAAKKVRDLITTHPGEWPPSTAKGRGVFDADPWAPTWSGGFLTGQLWVHAQRTGDPWWREQAEKYSLLLEPRKHDVTTHDIGFLFDHSWGRWYDFAPSSHAAAVLITAGRSMASRYREQGGYLCTWVDPGSTFIDVMMNVGIIMRAAELSGDQKLHDIAVTHTRTSLRYLVRGDGSTVHEGWFDTTTGEFLRAATHQGSRADSSWARGQSWAIYGFTTMYRYTGDEDFLDAARRTADYFLAHTLDDGVPPNDFRDADRADKREASAGAIAAAGLLLLSRTTEGLGVDGRYGQQARRLVNTLSSTEYISADLPDYEGVLRHATYHYRNGLGVDESVMWGDHFLVEALDGIRRADQAQNPEGGR